ncbi:hypothetical protein PPL_12539 [Heterostelium album PN500]|uniref:THUMP domain-containing protein n=1 Tax=Heterostelium pallidum (strain ATCC 26659 / Pp 5 / PN500) TaxID=670386 RepID=D3BMW6_HETP5|nr:hypothetical protein PPL_12539 [Heterostelium album PN500]EFA77328.1 hypothetical protein PPL_12539 [Heterostelium album PN500]|eukprot:XP_020429457.1 hypothetical protein PPL_12539 [Heterostelium album PN500]
MSESERNSDSLKRDHQSINDEPTAAATDKQKINESRKKKKLENNQSKPQSLYKGRYTKWKKHSRLFGTTEQVKGFLVTCDKAREAHSIGETLILLNAYADQFFPEISKTTTTTTTDDDKSKQKTQSKEEIKQFLHSRGMEVDEDEDDEEDEDESGAGSTSTVKAAKRFELINAACGGMYVISLLHDTVDPVVFISAIIVDLHKRFNKNQSDNDRFKDILTEPVKEMLANSKNIEIPERCFNIKFTNRLTPIQRSTVASIDTDVIPVLKSLLEKSFKSDKPESFAIELRSRNNISLDKANTIGKLAALIDSPPHKVDLSNPDKTLIIENIKSAITMAIAPNYKTFFKFNLKEAIGNQPPQSKPKQQQQTEKQQPTLETTKEE